MPRAKKPSAAAENAPPSLREKILQAAFIEFGDKGFAAARMDEIAAASGSSKQLLYHYFTSKEGLFEATLREAYVASRSTDDQLMRNVNALEPVPALRLFVDHLFRFSTDALRFQQLVHDENRFGGVHAAKLDDARADYRNLIEIVASILVRGADKGVFRPGLDPVQVYVSLAGLFVFPITNAHTLSIMLGIDLNSDEGAARSRAYAMDLILQGLSPVASPSK